MLEFLKGIEYSLLIRPLRVRPCYWSIVKMSSAESMKPDRDTVPFNRPSRQEKKAARIAKRKADEKKRIAEKRAKNRIESVTNDSDVISKGDLSLTSYYSENGLRKVYPYYFTFETHAKGRWFGKKLVDIFSQEFNFTKESMVKRLEAGNLTVNGKKVDADYVIKSQNLLRSTIHRHERPVTNAVIEIIENSEDLLVVNKPSSIPIHPCGKHRFNSLTYVLAKQYGFQNLRSVFRLDRMTSGVMMFGKTQGRANEIIEAIQKRETEKTYVCRVEGEFPQEIIECREPIRVLCQSIGLQIVGDGGKDAHTTFERLNYNGTSSTVKCTPHTGRTHQIRVHLQYLGHPIVNDELYNCDAWGPMKGKQGHFGKSNEQLIQDIYDLHTPGRIAKRRDSETTSTSSKAENSTADNIDCKHIDTNSICKVAEKLAEKSKSDDLDTSCDKNNKSSELETTSSSTSVHIDTSNSDYIVSVDNKSDVASSELCIINHPQENNLSNSNNQSEQTTVSQNQEPQCKRPKLSESTTIDAIEAQTDISINTLNTNCVKSNIANDAKTDNTVEQNMDNQGHVENCVDNGWINKSGRSKEAHTQSVNESTDALSGESTDALSGDTSLPAFDPSLMTYDENCDECQMEYQDPGPGERCMYLHAWRNKGPTWDYSTDLPDWAHESWTG